MKKRLLSLLIMTMMTFAALAPILPVYAASSSAVVNIVITGTSGGTIRITRADGTSGDPNCSNSVSIPASGKDQTFTHDSPGAASMNPSQLNDGPYVGEYYDYIVEQLPGTDPDINYDSSKYTVRVYVGYSDDKGTPEDSTRASSVVIIQKDDEDEKPANIKFENTVKLKPVVTEEEKTVTRTITYTENYYNGESDHGKTVAADDVRTVTLVRTVTYDPNTGNTTYGPWKVKEDADNATTQNVASPDHKDKSTEGWTPDIAVIPKWTTDTSDSDYSAWGLDLSDPKDVVLHVIYTKPDKPAPPIPVEEYKTVTRVITYTKYTADGDVIYDTVTQTVTLKRTGSKDPATGATTWDNDGKWVVDSYTDSGDSGRNPMTSSVKSPEADHSDKDAYGRGWYPDKSIVPEWNVDLSDPQDAYVHVIYTPKSIDTEETLTVSRRITYSENYYNDEGNHGKEVAADHYQEAVLKRTCTYDPVTGANTYSDWSVVSGDLDAVRSPDHADKASEGWTPNIDVVPAWNIDLTDRNLRPASDGLLEDVHVIYTKEDKPGERMVTTDEYRTVTRTITYTEYTADGKTVARTVVQTVTLKRTRTDYIDDDGNVIPGRTTYSRWSIVEGDTSAVTSPKKDGWTPNMKKVGKWNINLDEPQDEIVHVIYTPDDSDKPGEPETPDEPDDRGKGKIREIIDTGDRTVIGLWAAASIGASILLIGVVRRRRRA